MSNVNQINSMWAPCIEVVVVEVIFLDLLYDSVNSTNESEAVMTDGTLLEDVIKVSWFDVESIWIIK